MQPEEWNVRNHRARAEEAAVDYLYRKIGIVFLVAAIAFGAGLLSARNGATYLMIAVAPDEADATVTPCTARFSWCPLSYRFVDRRGNVWDIRVRYTLPRHVAGDVVKIAYSRIAPRFSAPIDKLAGFGIDGAVLAAAVVVILAAAVLIGQCLRRIKRLSCHGVRHPLRSHTQKPL